MHLLGTTELQSHNTNGNLHGHNVRGEGYNAVNIFLHKKNKQRKGENKNVE